MDTFPAKPESIAYWDCDEHMNIRPLVLKDLRFRGPPGLKLTEGSNKVFTTSINTHRAVSTFEAKCYVL